MTYYVTADWSRFVPEGDPEASYGVSPSDVDRLGLREKLDAFLAPPVVKQMSKPLDKAVKRPPEDK